MPYGIVALKPRLFPVSIFVPNSIIALIIKRIFVNYLQIIIHFYVYVCSHAHFLCVYVFQGDTILETGEVVPDLPEADSHGHH